MCEEQPQEPSKEESFLTYYPNHKEKMKKLPLLIPIILIAAQAVQAGFTIDPQNLIFKVSRGERMGWIELTHTGGPPIAVELTAHKRILNLDGELMGDSLQKVDDFMIYPAQVLLYPGGKAKAQVVLRGKQSITADKAYILFAKEVPFDFPSEEWRGKASTDISMTVAFQTIIALETNKSGSLTFVSSKALDSGYVDVIVENKSSGRVSTEYIYIMAGSKKITEFTNNSGNSIMPGQKRRFIFKHSKPLTAKEFNWGTN
jgi:P pilus assembly chaperone PapD